MDNANATQQAAADRMLEKGVRVSVSSPLFLRIFGIKTIALYIRATRYGTQIKLASRMLSIEANWDKLAAGDTDEARRLLSVYGKLVSRIIAFVILDRWWLIPLLTRPLAWYIRTHCKLKEVSDMFLITQVINNPAAFTNSITLTRAAAETTMTPKNVSQTEEGS